MATTGCPGREYLKGMEEGTLTEAQIADYQVPGPFSFIGYLKYILEGSTWGDQGLLTLISMMWQVTITIVNAEDLSQIKIRHQRPLDQVNLVVVLAQRCHYLGTCKYDFCSLFLKSAVWCEYGSVQCEPSSIECENGRTLLLLISTSEGSVLVSANIVLYGARMVLYGARMVLYGVSLVSIRFCLSVIAGRKSYTTGVTAEEAEELYEGLGMQET